LSIAHFHIILPERLKQNLVFDIQMMNRPKAFCCLFVTENVRMELCQMNRMSILPHFKLTGIWHTD